MENMEDGVRFGPYYSFAVSRISNILIENFNNVQKVILKFNPDYLNETINFYGIPYPKEITITFFYYDPINKRIVYFNFNKLSNSNSNGLDFSEIAKSGSFNYKIMRSRPPYSNENDCFMSISNSDNEDPTPSFIVFTFGNFDYESFFAYYKVVFSQIMCTDNFDNLNIIIAEDSWFSI
jgi:hypothetical protein